MLNMCFDHADQLDIQFNTKKSCLLHIGNSFNKKIENLQLNGQDIYWFEKIKYLGVYIVSGKSFTVDVSTRIRKFYASANAIAYYIIQSMLMSYHVLVYVNHLCCQY